MSGSATLGGALPQASLDLLAEWLPRLPQLGALVYDASATEGQPARAEVIAAQMQTLRLLWQTRGQATVKGRARNEQPAAGGAVGGAACSVELWERALAALVQGRELPAGGRGLRPLMSDPGLGLYRLQLQAQRSSLLAETLPLTWRALHRKLGACGVQALLLAHWQRPEALAMDEARHFARFLRQAMAEGQVAVPHLRSVLDFEMACVEISWGGAETQVHCDCEPLVLRSALSRGEWPAEAGSATAPGRVTSAPRPALEPSASA